MTENYPSHPTADAFFSAVECSDWTRVRDLSAPDAVFVQHVGPGAGSERDVDALIDLLSETAKHLGSLGYSNVRRQTSTAGFAQFHTLTFGGRPRMEVSAIVIAWLDDIDRIARVDEFIDPRPFER